VEGLGLDVRGVLEQPIENIDGFPHSARDKVAEQGDIGVGDVIVALSEQPSYAKEIDLAFVIIDVRSIGRVEQPCG
jgi:hypothetical protein